MSEGVCFEAGCGAVDCNHLRWVDDGLGQWGQQCRPGCDVTVVRPGKFQCTCPDVGEGCTGEGRGQGGPCPCLSCTPIHVAGSKENDRLVVDRGPDQEDQ